MSMTLTVRYTCTACGLHQVPCQVPARADTDDLRLWVGETLTLVATDHRRRSPACRATALTSLLIPITGADKIGGPPLQ
jgi:hypothetical protein